MNTQEAIIDTQHEEPQRSPDQEMPDPHFDEVNIPEPVRLLPTGQTINPYGGLNPAIYGPDSKSSFTVPFLWSDTPEVAGISVKFGATRVRVSAAQLHFEGPGPKAFEGDSRCLYLLSLIESYTRDGPVSENSEYTGIPEIKEYDELLRNMLTELRLTLGLLLGNSPNTILTEIVREEILDEQKPQTALENEVVELIRMISEILPFDSTDIRMTKDLSNLIHKLETNKEVARIVAEIILEIATKSDNPRDRSIELLITNAIKTRKIRSEWVPLIYNAAETHREDILGNSDKEHSHQLQAASRICIQYLKDIYRGITTPSAEAHSTTTILISGEPNVGKTSMCRAINGTFPNIYSQFRSAMNEESTVVPPLVLLYRNIDVLERFAWDILDDVSPDMDPDERLRLRSKAHKAQRGGIPHTIEQIRTRLHQNRLPEETLSDYFRRLSGIDTTLTLASGNGVRKHSGAIPDTDIPDSILTTQVFCTDSTLVLTPGVGDGDYGALRILERSTPYGVFGRVINPFLGHKGFKPEHVQKTVTDYDTGDAEEVIDLLLKEAILIIVKRAIAAIQQKEDYINMVLQSTWQNLRVLIQQPGIRIESEDILAATDTFTEINPPLVSLNARTLEALELFELWLTYETEEIESRILETMVTEEDQRISMN